MSDHTNVTQLPEAPRRCEYPHCWEKSKGFAKKFGKHFCNEHRKLLLLAVSYLEQLEDERKREEGMGGLIDRLQALNSKKDRVFVVDKQMMNEIMGKLVDLQTAVDKK